MEQDVTYQGNNFQDVKAVDAKECRKLCLQHPQCAGWTWVSYEFARVDLRGNCYFKSKMENRMDLLQAVSGTGHIKYC